MGRQVAAEVEGNWILANVVKYTARTKLYEVEDVDEEALEDGSAGAGKQKHLVPANCVVPLPTADSPLVFSRGDRVLALFPGTTSFYAANVNTSQEKNGFYSVRFDDDEDEDGRAVKKRQVPSYFVCPHPSE